jgi:hypothetical protein
LDVFVKEQKYTRALFSLSLEESERKVVCEYVGKNTRIHVPFFLSKFKKIDIDFKKFRNSKSKRVRSKQG